MSDNLGARYRLGRALGVGGGGVVHDGERVFELGAHGTLERPCAIKLIHESQAGDASASRAFTREGMLGYEVTAHPNLVATRDIQVTRNGRLFLVMDLLAHTLEDIMSRVHVDMTMIRAIAESVLSALSVLHARGMVHRDVHAGNIYISTDGTIKLGDLGRAASIRDEPGWRPCDDLRKLGLIVRWLVLGRTPFDSDHQLTPLPHDTPAEIRALAERLNAPTVAAGEGALSAAELATLLRASYVEIASAASIAARFGPNNDADARDARDANNDANNDANAPPERSTAVVPPATKHVYRARRRLFRKRLQTRLRNVTYSTRSQRQPHSQPDQRRQAHSRQGYVIVGAALIGGLIGALVVGSVARWLVPERVTVRTDAVAAQMSEPRPRATSRSPVTSRSEPRDDTPTTVPVTRKPDDHLEHRLRRARAPQKRIKSPPKPAVASPDALSERAQYKPEESWIQFNRRGTSTAGVRVIVARGEWLSNDRMRLFIHIDNDTATTYRFHDIALSRTTGRFGDVQALPLLAETNGANARISEVSASGFVAGRVIIPNASLLAGQRFTLIFRGFEAEEPLVVTGLEF